MFLRRFEKVVVPRVGGHVLTVDVMSTNLGTARPAEQAYECILFSVDLMGLEYAERYLDCLRWKRYTSSFLPRRVCYYALNPTGQALTSYFNKSVTWIDENLDGRWGFQVDIKSVGDIDIYWEFESLTDALLFKLSN